MIALMLVCVLGAAPAGLGSPLRQDGYQFRPPAGFRMAHRDLFQGSMVATPASHRDSERALSAALLDGDDEDAASLLISVIEGPLSLGPFSRDEFSTSVMRHFRDELDLPFALERAEARYAGVQRVEVTGSIRHGAQVRRVLLAAYPGQFRHVVVLFSVPSGRWEALEGTLRASLETMRLEGASAGGPPQPWRLAFAALAATLLAFSAWLWRRRRASESNER